MTLSLLIVNDIVIVEMLLLVSLIVNEIVIVIVIVMSLVFCSSLLGIHRASYLSVRAKVALLHTLMVTCLHGVKIVVLIVITTIKKGC